MGGALFLPPAFCLVFSLSLSSLLFGMAGWLSLLRSWLSFPPSFFSLPLPLLCFTTLLEREGGLSVAPPSPLSLTPVEATANPTDTLHGGREPSCLLPRLFKDLPSLSLHYWACVGRSRSLPLPPTVMRRPPSNRREGRLLTSPSSSFPAGTFCKGKEKGWEI